MSNFDNLLGASDLPPGPDLEGIPTDFEQAAVEVSDAGINTSKDDQTQETKSTANDEVTQATAVESGEPPDDIQEAAIEDSETKPPVPQVFAADPKKAVSFKVGDQEVALDESAQFSWKVDGKTEQLTLKDLISNYAGKIPIEKRFAELDRARKTEAQRVTEFENTRTRHSNLIRDMHEHVSKGNIFEAVANMLEMSGIKSDPREFVGSMRAKMMEQAQALAQMTPEQRENYEAKEAYAYLQSKHDRMLKQREQEQAQAAFRARVDKAIESVGSNLEEYAKQKQWLEAEFDARKFDKSQLTPEYVANFIQHKTEYETAKSALAEVSPELAEDEKAQEQGVLLMRQNPTWTKEDLRDVFKEALGQKGATAVSKKVDKAPVATVAAAAANAKAAPKTQKEKLAVLRASQDPDAYSKLPAEAFDWKSKF